MATHFVLLMQHSISTEGMWTFHFNVWAWSVFIIRVSVEENVSSFRWAKWLKNRRFLAWMACKFRATVELRFAIRFKIFDVQFRELAVRDGLIALLEIAWWLVHVRWLHVGEPLARRSEFQLRPLLCELLSDDDGDSSNDYQNYLWMNTITKIIIKNQLM